MARKELMEILPENLPDLEEPCSICLLPKATKITIGPTYSVSILAPGLMIQMDFASFNDETICGFTYTFVAICSATSYHFRVPSRSKRTPLGILKFIVTKKIN